MCLERDRFLSPPEVAQVRAAAARVGGLPQTFVEVALGTGLRVSELASLRVGDIDLVRCNVRVRRLKKKDKERPPDRVPIPQACVDTLRRHLASLGTIDPGAPLWPGRRGALTANALWRAWAKVIRESGLQLEKGKAGCHLARHTVGTALMASAPNPSQALRLVQLHLGHSSPDVTAHYYADVPWSDHVAAVEKALGSP